MIYEYLVTRYRRSIRVYYSRSWGRVLSHPNLTAPLLKTSRNPYAVRLCRQIYYEMLPFIYNIKSFSFHSAYDARIFLCQIGPNGRDLIKEVKLLFHLTGASRHSFLHTHTREEFAAIFQQLTTCRNLKVLTVCMAECDYDSRNPTGHPVCTIRGLKQLKVERLRDQPEGRLLTGPSTEEDRKYFKENPEVTKKCRSIERKMRRMVKLPRD